MTPIDGETLKKSYISYNVLRLPIMLEWQKRIGCHDAFLALGPSVEYRWHEHSRYPNTTNVVAGILLICYFRIQKIAVPLQRQSEQTV